MIRNLLFLSISLLAFSCTSEKTDSKAGSANESQKDTLRYPEEGHLKNVRMLTKGGNNAEAYFSFDNTSLVFQSDYAEWGNQCDQIFSMPVTGTLGSVPQKISNGKGRTTCAYYMPGNQEILFASTHLAADTCPAVPPRQVDGHYVWPIYSSYDIFIADTKGTLLRQLTKENGYDAEAVVSPDGKKIVFTSTRSGDLELWSMNVDGTELKQITKELGYDGGANFSPDSKRIVWRASRPTSPEDQKTYKDLLKKGLVQPTNLEVFVANVDGSDAKQITQLGKANWAPNWHPSGKKIIFASNHKTEKGRNFNLFLIDLEGKNLEQLSFDKVFDSFPMFSFDGKWLAFSSNRFNGGTHDTNVFIAEWVD